MQSLEMSQEAELRLSVVSAVRRSPAVRDEGLTMALHAALAGVVHSRAVLCGGTITVLLPGLIRQRAVQLDN